MRPVTEARCPPVPGEVIARHRVGDQSSVGGTVAAICVRVRSTIDRVLGGDLSDRGGAGFSGRNVSLVILSIDVEIIYEAVTTRGWNEGEGCGEQGWE